MNNLNEYNEEKFKHAFELKVNDILKTTQKTSEILSIEVFDIENVIGLVLENNGCYFANDILSHSQHTHPAFVDRYIGATELLTFRAMSGTPISDGSSSSATKSSDSGSSGSSSDSGSSCVIFGTLVRTSETTNEYVENLKPGDFVYGLESLDVYKMYEIEQKLITQNQSVLCLQTDTNSLTCTESHCVFSFTDNNFRFIWQLKPGDYIQSFEGIERVVSVVNKGQQSVVTLRLKDKGTYFANNLLSHTQLENPNYQLAVSTDPNKVFFRTLAGVTKSSAAPVPPSPAPPGIFSFRAMSDVTENNFSGFDSSYITKTETGEKMLADLTLEDKVMGYDEKGDEVYYEISAINKMEVHYLEISFGDDKFYCSKYSCVFSDSLSNFCYAHQLKVGDYLKGSSINKKITSVKLIDKQEFYSVELSDRGCYFVNDILVHSQDTLPKYALHVAKTKNLTRVSHSELSKVIKAHSKNIFPSWKYEKSNSWKKAHYLSDLKISEREVGYVFSTKMKINAKLTFDLKQYAHGYILIKIVGLNSNVTGKFENVGIDSSEFKKISINDEEYIFLSLDRYQSSKKLSSFDFLFDCEKENLLVNLNVINDVEYQCLQNFFEV